MLRILRWLALALLVAFIALQLVPVEGLGSNPPVAQEVAWNSPRTRELYMRACGDCHSNETKWPWYSRVAPVSWRIAEHVRKGRRHLNTSEWNRPQKHAHDAAEELQEGAMPLADYLRFHPEARLSASEKAELVGGLIATLGARGEGEGEEHEERRGEGGRGRSEGHDGD